jgi:hypothetical protein
VTNVEGRAVKAVKSIQETFTVWSAPGGNESYKNPSHPSTDKYPTQVTDTDVDCLSMEVTPSARYRFTAQGSSVLSASYSFSPTSASSRSNALSTTHSSSEASAALSPSLHSSHQSDLGLPLNCSPKYVQYTTLASRLDTFHSSKWLVNEKPDINTFTNQGMFYTGMFFNFHQLLPHEYSFKQNKNDVLLKGSFTVNLYPFLEYLISQCLHTFLDITGTSILKK